MRTRSKTGFQTRDGSSSPLPLLPAESNSFFGAPMKNVGSFGKQTSLLAIGASPSGLVDFSAFNN
tara:strand:+ start:290 stop:484 length:195 start_codon:yes stop_codon:yes gene_type:complete